MVKENENKRFGFLYIISFIGVLWGHFLLIGKDLFYEHLPFILIISILLGFPFATLLQRNIYPE